MRILRVVLFSMLAFLCGPWAEGQVAPFATAPDFQLSDIDGNSIHLYGLLDEGKVVILDFYAVWCGSCQANASALESVYQELGPNGTKKLEVLSLETDPNSTDAQVRTYVTLFHSSNPHINATKNVAELYSQLYYPTYLVVAPDRSYVQVTGTSLELQADLIEAVKTAPPLRTTLNDIRLRSYLKPKGSYCLSAINPELILQNYGKNTIHNFTISVQIDGETTSSYYSIDSLTPYEVRLDTLPWISELNLGWHEIEFTVQSVNGEVGDDFSNDSLRGLFKIVPNGEDLVIQTFTDGYPKETYWEILENGKLITEESWLDQPNTRHTSTICVDPTGCLTLNVYDRFGDGLGAGEVLVLYHGDTLAYVEPWTFYGGFISKSFCFPGSAGLDPTVVNYSFQMYPNPACDRVQINLPDNVRQPIRILLLNPLGQTVLDQTINGQSLTELDLQPFPRGLYVVKILTDSSTFAGRLLIEK